METPQTPLSSGKVAWKQGLIFGLGLAVINIIFTVIGDFAHLGGAGFLITILAFLVDLAAYGFAGFQASKQTGRAGTGSLAGLFTGLIASIIGAVVSIVLFFTVLMDSAVQAAQKASTSSNVSADTMKNIVIGGYIGIAVFGVLIALGIGAGVGALGGLVGRGRANIQPVEYQQPY
jgi:uncharacterized membrane protein